MQANNLANDTQRAESTQSVVDANTDQNNQPEWVRVLQVQPVSNLHRLDVDKIESARLKN